MPIGFVGPALQGASFISRIGVPLLQQAGLAAGLAGIGAGISAATNKPSTKTTSRLTGRQRLGAAWGTIPSELNSRQGGNFGYAFGDGQRGRQPSYMDAQGNRYDAVSGRLLYAARTPNAPSTSTEPRSGVGQSPSERAYQSSRAEAAAMTASDPLFKKYQVADLTKAYNAAKTNEEKQSIGLQIWAQTNPQLAAKLRSGQTGYEEVRQAPGMMASTGDFRPIAGGVLPADVDSTSLAKAPTFAQPENPLEEVPPPGMLGSSFPGGLQFPESIVPAGVGENMPTESFEPTALEVFDPSAIDLNQVKRKLLIQAYNRGLK